LCSHQELFTSWELFENPDHATLVWNVFNSSDVGLEYWRINIRWNRNNDFNVVGYRLLFELGFSFNDKFNLGFSKVFNNGLNPDQRLNMCIQSVGHQLKFTVRWDESNQSLRFEFIKSYALMELNVLHFNQFIS
jgi:hypothetical protein